ncbi:hypothetical protein ACJX0J_035730, partial [Zea mays]
DGSISVSVGIFTTMPLGHTYACLYILLVIRSTEAISNLHGHLPIYFLDQSKAEAICELGSTIGAVEEVDILSLDSKDIRASMLATTRAMAKDALNNMDFLFISLISAGRSILYDITHKSYLAHGFRKKGGKKIQEQVHFLFPTSPTDGSNRTTYITNSSASIVQETVEAQVHNRCAPLYLQNNYSSIYI